MMKIKEVHDVFARTRKDYLGDAQRRNLLHARDYFLKTTRPLMDRHDEELRAGVAKTTLTESQVSELANYLLCLRDIEKHEKWPYSPGHGVMPSPPEFCNIEALSVEVFERNVYQTAFSNLRGDCNSAIGEMLNRARVEQDGLRAPHDAQSA